MNTEVLKQIIHARKSSYPAEYIDGDINPSIIDEIIDSANYAPSHKKTRPWRLRVFQGNEKIALGKQMALLYEATTSSDKFSQRKHDEIAQKAVQAHTMVSIGVNFSKQVPDWEEIAATAMAVQNMYLTCAAHNVGCYWASPGFIHNLKPYLQLEENQECYGIFFIGKIV